MKFNSGEIWKCSPGTASLAEVELEGRRMIAAMLRVREGDAERMASNPSGCQVGCRLFRQDHVLVVLLLFRFFGDQQTYVSTINLCDGSAVAQILHRLANSQPLNILLFEHKPEPIAGWDLQPSSEPWTSLLRATEGHSKWSEQDFQTALRALLDKVRIDQLWFCPTAPHVSSLSSLPKIRVISTSEELDAAEAELRESGKGELVDALRRHIRKRRSLRSTSKENVAKGMVRVGIIEDLEYGVIRAYDFGTFGVHLSYGHPDGYGSKQIRFDTYVDQYKSSDAFRESYEGETDDRGFALQERDIPLEGVAEIRAVAVQLEHLPESHEKNERIAMVLLKARL